MNCSVCGSPLLFDRVVFKCSCGAYVHAYCADKHIVDSHRPEMEEGHADLNGEFHLKYQPVAARAVETVDVGESTVDAPDDDESLDEELLPGEQVADVTPADVEEDEISDDD